MHKILIVEDKASMAKMLRETLEAEGYSTVTAANGKDGIGIIAAERPDLVLTDLKLPGADGIKVLKAAKEDDPIRPVIVMTAFGTVQTAVEAMKQGAFDFITKPFDTDHLIVLIRRALENRRLITENIVLRDACASHVGMPEIVGKSRSVVEVAENVRKVAPTKTTVLLLGESGTGKELFARAIHQLSDRKDYPFVAINCAAIPGELLESELFGYEKGAFTGADARKTGKFELADKGTIFLDEIGDMHPALQVKILRVLEEGEIERIGGKGPVKINVRVVAATNKDLQQAVSAGAFREDLFYRLNVFPLVMPPLRDRKEDIPLLVEHFISSLSPDGTTGGNAISEKALEFLVNYGWKGNIRELKNAIERAIILSDGDTIAPEHLSLEPIQSDSPAQAVSSGGTLSEVSRGAIRVAETTRIKQALKNSGGNKTKAAKELDVSYKTLLTKIKEYGIG